MQRFFFLAFSLYFAHSALAVTGRRGFLISCLKSITNPAGALVKVVDPRAEFAGIAEEVSQKFSHVNVLRLGSASDLNPWNVTIEDLAQNPAKDGATVNLYSLTKREGELYYHGLLLKDKSKTPKDGLHIIFDPGSGSMANLLGLSQGLHRAQGMLVEGGVLAIYFPISQKPFEEFAASAVERITSAFSYDLLNIGLQKRYAMVEARRGWNIFEQRGPVRFDGCFIKTLDGRFLQLADWIELRFPDFEVVRPLLASFNQLIVKRKKLSKKRSDFAFEYVGSFGKVGSPNLVATPFHFFEERSLDPNYVATPFTPNIAGGTFSGWIRRVFTKTPDVHLDSSLADQPIGPTEIPAEESLAPPESIPPQGD